ncbi:N-acetyltransferase GCN5 [Pseudomonas sp. StFLB209]|uniref:GNAT family N-acetyltransferase n=1 Tax=Pseudomonas sp. StFLB209 TaxID=1028989 RepID=UPI0004F73BFE|nr:GNAT family N-acetyltransferase [Pseudomonas sp. StFLB209]BAP40762.1 N-acetyltransferase GCN5 [Pseudomonas sp. StFLB209]
MDAPIPLQFNPIDLDRHADLCVRFREDVFQLALGTTLPLHGEDGQGAGRYLDWLAQRSQALPGSMMHVWQGDEIVGQLELNQPQPALGYVHLFYLTEPYRHLGLGQQLHDRAIAFFRQRQCTTLQLSASPDNLPALRFYQRNGWRDIGPREATPGVNLFERVM